MMASILQVLLVLFVFIGHPADKSEQKPVKWTFESKKTGDNEYDLIFKAKIEKGYHVYSQNIDEGGPIPTSFIFTPSDGYQLINKVEEKSKVIKVHDPNFDMDLRYFSNTAEFLQHVKITGQIKSITGKLQYMSCNDKKCFPPEDVDFVFNLTK
jgi:hypothetical protein